jgi:hypothetical protein
LYTGEYVGYILRVSSLKNIAFIGNSTVTQRGISRTFTVSFDSIGQPSCARIWYKVGTNTSKSITYGTTSTYCASSFPGVTYSGPYVTISANLLTFDLAIVFEGLVDVNFLIKNDIESFQAVTNVTISGVSCKRPTLDIENRSPDFFNPTVIVRSKMFTLIGITILECDTNLQNLKQWFLYEINPSTGSTTRTISLNELGSAFNAELFIQGNYLAYGTYKFVYQVNMNGGDSPFQGTVETYIRIIPTGIGIFAFSGGIREVTRGTAQSIEVNPGKYSFDFDGIYTGVQLSYRFYCRIVVDGLPYEFPSTSFNNYVDLLQIKNDNSLVEINSTNICFDSTGLWNFC